MNDCKMKNPYFSKVGEPIKFTKSLIDFDKINKLDRETKALEKKIENDKHNELVNAIKAITEENKRLSKKNSIQNNIITYLSIGMFFLTALIIYLMQNPNG